MWIVKKNSILFLSTGISTMAKPCMLLWGQNKRTKRIQGKDFDFNRVPYTFYVRSDGATYFLVNRDKQFFFFFWLWFAINDIKIFSCPRERIFLIKHDPWMKVWIKHNSCTILFSVMIFCILAKSVNLHFNQHGQHKEKRLVTKGNNSMKKYERFHYRSY